MGGARTTTTANKSQGESDTHTRWHTQHCNLWRVEYRRGQNIHKINNKQRNEPTCVVRNEKRRGKKEKNDKDANALNHAKWGDPSTTGLKENTLTDAGCKRAARVSLLRVLPSKSASKAVKCLPIHAPFREGGSVRLLKSTGLRGHLAGARGNDHSPPSKRRIRLAGEQDWGQLLLGAMCGHMTYFFQSRDMINIYIYMYISVHAHTHIDTYGYTYTCTYVLIWTNNRCSSVKKKENKKKTEKRVPHSYLQEGGNEHARNTRNHSTKLNDICIYQEMGPGSNSTMRDVCNHMCTCMHIRVNGCFKFCIPSTRVSWESVT